MAIIDVIKFDGLASRDWLVYKYPGNDFATTSRLVVGEGQVAIFVKSGRILDIFSAGTHILSTENIPLLKVLVNIPFGGNTPFSAEVYFLNKTTKLDILWGTADPIQLIDPKYKIKLRVRAFGQLGMKIDDFRVFFTELIGTLGSREVINYSKVLDFYKGLLMTKVKSTIAKVIVNDKISALEIVAHLDSISAQCRTEVEKYFFRYGLKVTNLFIKSINFPDEDFAEINKLLTDKAAFDIIGDKRYISKRSFDVMETAAGNESDGNLMQTGLSLGLGVGMAQVAANTAGNFLHPQINMAKQPAFSIACPTCAFANAESAKFCTQCGAGLLPTKQKCSSCDMEIEATSKFCPHCGAPAQSNSNCPGCGQENISGAKFCTACGDKLV